jgi:hypothetical protein
MKDVNGCPKDGVNHKNVDVIDKRLDLVWYSLGNQICLDSNADRQTLS